MPGQVTQHKPRLQDHRSGEKPRPPDPYSGALCRASNFRLSIPTFVRMIHMNMMNEQAQGHAQVLYFRSSHRESRQRRPLSKLHNSPRQPSSSSSVASRCRRFTSAAPSGLAILVFDVHPVRWLSSIRVARVEVGTLDLVRTKRWAQPPTQRRWGISRAAKSFRVY